MSDMLAKLQHTHTGMRSVTDSKRMAVCSPTTEREIEGSFTSLNHTREYVMEVVIGTYYRMHDASDKREKQEMQKKARLSLAHELYKDVIGIIQIAEMEINSGHSEDALRTLLELRAKLIS